MIHYLVAGSIALGVLLLVGGVRWVLMRRLAKAHLTPTDVDDFVLDVAQRTKLLLLLLPAAFLGARALELPLEAAKLLRAGAGISFTAQAAIWIAGVVDFWLRRQRRTRMETDPAAAMTVNVFRIAALTAIWLIAAVVVIDNLGFNVTTLIAGLGIGGVAVALALQNILSDLFASLSIVVDKPFVLGDAIAVDNLSGTVEHIGLKTTRIRSSDGEQLVFSNGDLLKSRIRNFKRMTERRSVTRLAVDTKTEADKLARIPAILKAAVAKQAETHFDRAHLVKITDGGYELELVYFVPTADYGKFLDVQQAVFLDIIRSFAAEEIELASKACPCGAP